jgi:peptide/nickel transport system substrate-binding protein
MWKKRSTIIALALIVIVVVAAVTAAVFLYKPSSTGPTVLVGAGPRIRFAGFNIPKAPKDPNGVALSAAKYQDVRQAFAYAINRSSINTNVFLGLATNIYSMIPPSMPYSQPVFQTKYGTGPNLTAAENLLTVAGYNSSKNGKLYIDLWYNSDGHYGDTEPNVALVIKTSVEQTGMVVISLKSEPWAAYRGDLAAGNFPFYLLGWYPDYLDADDYAAPFFGTSGAIGQGSYYSNPQMDTWLKQEAGTTNDNFRAGNFTNIQNQSATDVPYIPLWQQTADVEYKQGITGVYLHPVSFKYFVMNNPGSATLNVGTTDSVVCLDPACAYDYYSIEVINQVFDTLLVYSPTNASLVPGLATTVPTIANGGISSDARNYTYHLRQNVKFTDGTPLNATVVKWSIERAMGLGDPTTGNPYFGGGNYAGSAGFLLFDSANLGPVSYTTETNANITVVDNYTIKFHLKQPTAFFNEIMAFSVSAPVSMSAYQKATPQPDDVAHVVGTGPYKVTGYTVDKSVTLVANANYYNPAIYSAYGIPTIPIIGTVVITHYSDATGLKNALVSGQIDMAYRTINPTDIKSLQGK